MAKRNPKTGAFIVTDQPTPKARVQPSARRRGTPELLRALDLEQPPRAWEIEALGTFDGGVSKLPDAETGLKRALLPVDPTFGGPEAAWAVRLHEGAHVALSAAALVVEGAKPGKRPPSWAPMMAIIEDARVNGAILARLPQAQAAEWRAQVLGADCPQGTPLVDPKGRHPMDVLLACLGVVYARGALRSDQPREWRDAYMEGALASLPRHLSPAILARVRQAWDACAKLADTWGGVCTMHPSPTKADYTRACRDLEKLLGSLYTPPPPPPRAPKPTPEEGEGEPQDKGEGEGEPQDGEPADGAPQEAPTPGKPTPAAEGPQAPPPRPAGSTPEEPPEPRTRRPSLPRDAFGIGEQPKPTAEPVVWEPMRVIHPPRTVPVTRAGGTRQRHYGTRLSRPGAWFSDRLRRVWAGAPKLGGGGSLPPLGVLLDLSGSMAGTWTEEELALIGDVPGAWIGAYSGSPIYCGALTILAEGGYRCASPKDALHRSDGSNAVDGPALAYMARIGGLRHRIWVSDGEANGVSGYAPPEAARIAQAAGIVRVGCLSDALDALRHGTLPPDSFDAGQGW